MKGGIDEAMSFVATSELFVIVATYQINDKQLVILSAYIRYVQRMQIDGNAKMNDICR